MTTIQHICPDCAGTGDHPYRNGRRCIECGGSGMVILTVEEPKEPPAQRIVYPAPARTARESSRGQRKAPVKAKADPVELAAEWASGAEFGLKLGFVIGACLMAVVCAIMWVATRG